MLSACEHISVSAFIPVSCDQDLPISLVLGEGGSRFSPGTVCEQLIGKNRSIRAFLPLWENPRLLLCRNLFLVIRNPKRDFPGSPVIRTPHFHC